MTNNKSFFTSFEDFNGENVTFSDDRVACVKSKGSVSIPWCPKLDEVLFVDGLKANLLSISLQICDSYFRVNSSQNLCEVINKKGKVIFRGPRIVDNYYAINPNF